MKRYVINLDRRPDRLEAFLRGLPEGVDPPERFAARDGNTMTPPPWWSAGRGAWGCYLSHLAIIEHCLADGQDVTIFEDDAALVPDYAERLRHYLAALPDDWEMAYLGGQLLRPYRNPPRRVNDLVYRPHNIHRTHAYMIRGTALPKIRQHLLRTDWRKGHHLDHHYGRLHESGEVKIYCPARWLAHQRPGRSNISGRDTDGFRWRDAVLFADVEQPQLPVVAVVGQFRGGTSAVAGALHKMGLSMGAAFRKPNPGNPKGYYEAVALARICRHSFREPWMVEQNTREQRVAELRRWAMMRSRQLKRGLIGAKHPTLCLIVPEMVEAWPDCRIVAVERPVETSIRSLKSRRWGWPPGAAEKVLPAMLEARDAALAELPSEQVMRLRYSDLIEDPKRTLLYLRGFVGIKKPSCGQIKAALQFIDPALNRHGGQP